MEAINPLHIAIIPDGNRRWAAKRALQPWKGHEEAITTIRTVLQWCEKNDEVSILTLWLFSTENWKRDTVEIEKLMNMLEDYLVEERTSFVEHNTRFVHSGKKDRIPKSLAAIIAEIEQETSTNSGHTLHLALDYGGRNEVVRAVKKIESTQDVSEDAIRASLDHPELKDIDIIVRTSGEQRTSNFFLWQSAYAEWFFVKKFFPDLTTEDLSEIIAVFKKRKRRFGS